MVQDNGKFSEFERNMDMETIVILAGVAVMTVINVIALVHSNIRY